jgi:hypothetical protein
MDTNTDPPPDPREFTVVARYLESLYEWLGRTRVAFGPDFVVASPGGTRCVNLKPKKRFGFEVYQTAANAVVVVGGYTVSKDAHNLYADETISGISADTEIWARYDQATAAWELVSTHPVQTGTITPADGKVTVRIATLTWSGTYSGIESITQHHVGSLVFDEISPVPEHGCLLWLDDVASIPDGYEEATELRGVYVAGLDSGDGDYDAVGVGLNTNAFTGYKLHGVTQNNHAPHWHDGPSPNITVTASTNISFISSTGPGTQSATIPTAFSADFGSLDGCPTGSLKWCNAEADTDNRPPTYVAVWIRRAFA